eukprot:983392-Amphidinium_carterae.1
MATAMRGLKAPKVMEKMDCDEQEPFLRTDKKKPGVRIDKVTDGKRVNTTEQNISQMTRIRRFLLWWEEQCSTTLIAYDIRVTNSNKLNHT